MKFASKYGNAIYIIRPTTRRVSPIGIVEMVPGLRAKFDRDSQQFDSVAAQEDLGWSDEEREAVEKALLNHKDYGNGLILLPGQEVPEKWNTRAQRITQTNRVCAHVEFDAQTMKVSQCENAPLPGGDKCETHREKKGQVVRGMLTAQ